MIKQEILTIPDGTVQSLKVGLSKSISAIQLNSKEYGSGGKQGVVSQLGPGTELVICGEGLNEWTVKVRANGLYYFVFSQDIASVTNSAH